MRKLIIILFICLLGMQGRAQTANAGADQTIYLTATNSATLDGSASSATSYLWTEVSTDYNSGATITNATSKTATVAALPQGVFYFQIAATTSGTTHYDTVKITVDVQPAPTGSTLLFNFNLNDSTIYDVINRRDDTTSYFNAANFTYSQTAADANGVNWIYYRGRTNDLEIDPQHGKLISMIEDGYGDTLNKYSRSEVQLSDANFKADTSKIYVIEWKGYLPQSYNYLSSDATVPSYGSILAMLQVHSLTETPTVYSNGINHYDSIHMSDYNDNTSTTVQKNYSSISNYYDKTHTLRVVWKEGNNGQTAFVREQLDGHTIYYRNSGQVGSNAHDDFLKFAGLYDYNKFMVNLDSLSRGRKYKLVTEAFKVYHVTADIPDLPTNLPFHGPFPLYCNCSFNGVKAK